MSNKTFACTEDCGYSMVKIELYNNALFLTDINDGAYLAIDPDSWGLIKKTVDQWISDGCLEDKK